MSTTNKMPIRLIEGSMYVRMDALVELGVVKVTIEQGYNRQAAHWQKLDDPEDLRCVLIAYEPMRQQYKDLVLRKFGEPSEWLQRQEAKAKQSKNLVLVANSLAPQIKDIAFFSRELAHRPTKERSKTAQQYAMLFEFLKACVQITPSECRNRFRYDTKEAFLTALLERCNEIELEFPVKIGSLAILQRKMWLLKKAYKEAGEDAARLSLMKEGKYSNKNRDSLKYEEQIMTLIALAAMSEKLPFTKVCQHYNVRARTFGWKEVCERTVQRFLKRPDIAYMYEKARHGRDAFWRKYDPSTNRKAPSAVNAMWVMDGTPLDWVFHEEQTYEDRATGKKKTRVNKWAKMYLYWVMDACTWKIIGYALAYVEDHTLVVDALRDSVRKTMLLPYQLQYDNSKANKKLTPLLNEIALYCTPSAPYNAKSKLIEAMTGHFQQEVLRFRGKNFTGQNITAKSLDSRANPDALKESLKEYYGKKELLQDLEGAINYWNNMETKERLAPNAKEELVCGAGQNAGRGIDYETFLNLFFVLDAKPITYRSNGITKEINKVKYRFIAEMDANLHLRLVGQKFQIKYDPDTLEYVHLYQNDRLVLDDNKQPIILELAKEGDNYPMAIYDYKEGDGKRIQEYIKFQKEVRETGNRMEKFMRETQAELNITLGHIFAEKDSLNDSENVVKMAQVMGNDAADEDFLEHYNNPYKR